MVKLTVLSSQVGTVTESDIKLAETFHGKKTEICVLLSETANVYSHSIYIQVCSQLFRIIKIVAIGAVVVVVSVVVNLSSLSSLLSLFFLSTSCQLCQIGSRCPSPFQFLKMSITAPHKYLSD